MGEIQDSNLDLQRYKLRQMSVKYFKGILLLLLCLTNCQSKEVIGISEVKIIYVDKDIETLVAIHPNYYRYAFGDRVKTVTITDPKKLAEVETCLAKVREIDSTTVDARVEVQLYRKDTLVYKIYYGNQNVLYVSPGKFVRNECLIELIDETTGFGRPK